MDISKSNFFQHNNSFDYKGELLHVDNHNLKELISEFGSPLYVYSEDIIRKNYFNFENKFNNFPHLICYAVKANSNLSILRIFAEMGAGFDTVSQGEIERVLFIGVDPKRIIFSGVGKTEDEIIFALENNIGCINIESEAELYLLNRVAERINKITHIAFRVNPDIDPDTHPYLSTGLKESKFGIDHESALQLYVKASNMRNLVIKGVTFHIGSQILQVKPFIDAFEIILDLVDKLKEMNIHLEHIDIGGGIGIIYEKENKFNYKDYFDHINTRMEGRSEVIYCEPGRCLVANSGVFLTKVLYTKENEKKKFMIVDGGMNDFPRVSLYNAKHLIANCNERQVSNEDVYDVVGPVCETGDFFAKECKINAIEGDVLCLFSAGAYCFSMSSNYNTRQRPAEVLIKGEERILIRKRETFLELIQNEIFDF